MQCCVRVRVRVWSCLCLYTSECVLFINIDVDRNHWLYEDVFPYPAIISVVILLNVRYYDGWAVLVWVLR